jgi:hypothetical protein
MEAEYMTLSESVRDLTHFINLAKQFSFYLKVPKGIPVLCDNQSAIFNSDNLVNNQRSKHIDIRYHFVREKIADNTINVKYVATTDNVADFFTKPLTSSTFIELRKQVMGC